MDASIASLNQPIPSGAEAEEVRPYKIHVSSKYLDLTRKKLELTRLPHEIPLPEGREWELGTPKGKIEPLIDFWLEQYSWRSHEAKLNELPQFRTAFPISPANSGTATEGSTDSEQVRIHFIHIPSSAPTAIPLLLIPSFPLSNLSLAGLFDGLKEHFHIVCPNIPGLGFSDALRSHFIPTRHGAGANGSDVGGSLAQTTHLFDALMKRLGYAYYIASATGSGRNSPAGIDYHLAVLLGENFPESCLGVHVLEPCVRASEAGTVGWLKWNVAKFFHGQWFGYTEQDWVGLRSNGSREGEGNKGYAVIGRLGLREPHTFSYALCDSPVGLLSFVLSALRKGNPNHALEREEIVNLAQLAWLPGPEAGMRFWASAIKELEASRRREDGRKCKVAITVFGGDGAADNEEYICPAWATGRHDVVFAQRVAGKAGLIIWERKEVIIDGIRSLAREVERSDNRVKVQALREVVVPLEEIIREESEAMSEAMPEEFDEEDESHRGLQLDAESPDTVVAVALS